MPYLMGGFPDAETATAVASAYAEAGADLVELGVPFSDPLADGPVIHDAATRALAAGAGLPGVLRTCEAIAGRLPVVPMCYANMILARGAGAFASELRTQAAAGTIVPDLPPEEAGEVQGELGGPRAGIRPARRADDAPRAPPPDLPRGAGASSTWSPTPARPASAKRSPSTSPASSARPSRMPACPSPWASASGRPSRPARSVPWPTASSSAAGSFAPSPRPMARAPPPRRRPPVPARGPRGAGPPGAEVGCRPCGC